MQIRLAALPAVFLCASMAFMGSANANTSALDIAMEQAALTAGETNEEADDGDAAAAVAEDEDDAAAATETKQNSSDAQNPYSDIISRHASAHGVSVSLAHAVVRVESNFRANATGAAGEIGLMQIKLPTARMMGYSGGAKGLYDPETNIRYGIKYLAKAQSLGDGSLCQTILRYNAGHGAKRMNPVSANYCNKVASILQ